MRQVASLLRQAQEAVQVQYKREKEMATRMFGGAAGENGEAEEPKQGLFSRFRRRSNGSNGSNGPASGSEGEGESGESSAEQAEGEDGAAKGGGFWSRFRRGPHHFEADEESDEDPV